LQEGKAPGTRSGALVSVLLGCTSQFKDRPESLVIFWPWCAFLMQAAFSIFKILENQYSYRCTLLQLLLSLAWVQAWVLIMVSLALP
ncbi:unnamed protein product, partial [Polarella glacialis]